MRTRAELFAGLCWAVVAASGAPSCRSGGAALGDAGDVSSPPADVSSPPEGTDDPGHADALDAPAAPEAPVAPDAAAETTDGAVPEKRCDVGFGIQTPSDLARFSDCTVLVGDVQEDSATELMDLAALHNVRRLEGILKIFRSPGFVTLHGLENLEEIQGHLYIHLNNNLVSIAALGKLRTVTGNVYIANNPKLPQAEVDTIAAGITVGGMKTLASAALEP